MTSAFKLLLLSLATSVLVACGNNSAESTVATSIPAITSTALNASIQAVDAYRPPEGSIAESPLKARDPIAAPTATNIAMGEPLASLTIAARKNNEASTEENLGKPLQIGFSRDVAQTATTTATNQALKWQATSSGGLAAAINFNSTGAKGIRIGLLVTKLPETATLRFYAKSATKAFEVKGSEVLKVLAANLAAGDKTDVGRTYVGPMIRSADATVEIELPAGVETSMVQVSAPSVSHIFMSMNDAQAATTQATYSGGSNKSTQVCQVDVVCVNPFPAASDSVAWLVYNKSGSTYICSGTMLNDNQNSGTPYLLTANHCISSQTVASTLYTEFKFRSLFCGNETSGEYYPTTTTGASLLYTAVGTDSTLLRLYGTPSTNVLFAGWDATVPPALNTVVHNIHHPRGDQQRISRGSITSYYAWNSNGGLDNTSITSGTILGVSQTSGNTEGGSSGSSLLKGTDANPQVIGQLYGRLLTNPTSSDPGEVCSNSTLKRIYGRFDVAFNAGMSDWLTQGVKTVAQLYNGSTGVHYYTIGVTDANNVVNANAGYSNQGSAFKASTIPAAGLSPVHRFFDTINGTTFYTISEKERAAVATNTPRMRYDGIVWYANATAAGGTVPLYRAFNTVTGSQFFTLNSATRTTFIAANPQFKTDGIAYYVQP